jgi:hypothetical protein
VDIFSTSVIPKMADQYIVNVDFYKSDFDSRQYQPAKRQRFNPVGEDIHILPDGSLARDEDKIIKIQQIFKENYYKPDSKGAQKILSKY